MGGWAGGTLRALSFSNSLFPQTTHVVSNLTPLTELLFQLVPVEGVDRMKALCAIFAKESALMTFDYEEVSIDTSRVEV